VGKATSALHRKAGGPTLLIYDREEGGSMQRFLDGWERIMLSISTVTTFILMVLTTADAGGRYLFNRPITGAYEISTNYLMILLVFSAMSYSYREGAHIRVTFLVDRLPMKVKLIVNYIVQMVSAIIGVLFVIATVQQSLLTMEQHTTLSSMPFIPLGPAYFIIPVGLFFMSLAMVLDLRKVGKGKSSLFKEESPTN
jgi:TRAP-type C4-dicarboxylate transport system permease small subunit